MRTVGPGPSPWGRVGIEMTDDTVRLTPGDGLVDMSDAEISLPSSKSTLGARAGGHHLGPPLGFLLQNSQHKV